MSYLTTMMQPTVGSGPRAYLNQLSPMMPSPGYAPTAAGPAFLGFGGLAVGQQRLRSHVPAQLRGFGAGLDDLLSGGLQPVVRAVIDEAWPIINEKMNASLRPMLIISGVTMAASLVAATLAVMRLREKR